MEYLVKSGSIASEKSACVIVPVFSNDRLSNDTKMLDELYGGCISAAIKAEDIQGKVGQTLLLRNPASALHKRILLVGCGDEKKLNIISLHKVLVAAAKAVKSTGSKDALLTLHRLKVNDHSLREKIRHSIVDFEDVFYKYDETFSKKKPASKLKQVKILTSNANETKQANKAIEQGTAIAAGQSLTKDLGNRPGNVCTPTHLADTARSIKRGQRKLSVSVLEEAEMEELGMGSLLSVSRGSVEPAKLIVLQYKGAAASKKPVVLVGKGITFDTGGISLKPGAAMDEMKFDMCGAASVLGTMKACAEMDLPINVVGVVASAENMPGGKATKPGDIVTTMSGKTVEILNTDAEGRLVLCDALTYVDRYKPDVVIDIATLTGACIVALGHEASGLMSNSDKLSQDLLETGQRTGDRAWQLPIWDEYQPLLDSNFADIANIGGRWAGTITAACFLSRFTEDYKWAHLDIAGTAWHMGKNKGATGRPVPLLTAYLMKKARVF